MWMLTPQGMFSAVADKQPDVLQVRCRSKKDAIGLANWLVDNKIVELDDTYPTAEDLVLEWPGRDYPCRLLLWRDQWEAYVVYSVQAITYGNFKNEVKKRQGARRAATYGQVWGVLLQIEKEGQPAAKDTGWGAKDDGFTLDDWLYGRSVFTGAGSISDGVETRVGGLNDTDDRCPRCDKFLNEVGVDAFGDCRKCVDDLEAAEERGDFADAEDIKLELGIV